MQVSINVSGEDMSTPPLMMPWGTCITLHHTVYDQCHSPVVVTSLVMNGETLDEVSLAGRCRATAIKLLCCMHPPQSAYVQYLAVTNCKHPTLALWLALEAEEKRAQ